MTDFPDWFNDWVVGDTIMFFRGCIALELFFVLGFVIFLRMVYPKAR